MSEMAATALFLEELDYGCLVHPETELRCLMPLQKCVVCFFCFMLMEMEMAHPQPFLLFAILS